MGSTFNVLGNFKNSKRFLFGVQPCFSVCMIACTFALLYHTKFYSRLYYQQDFQMSPIVNTSLPVLANNQGGSNSQDIVFKTNKIVEKPEDVAIAKNSTTFKNNKKSALKQLHDKHVYVKQTNVSSHQKDNEGKKAELLVHRKEDQDIGMNITHIHGLLMEPVNVNYANNIYFTIKITHKHYTDRLLPLMLTWLQAVDKNKVR